MSRAKAQEIAKKNIEISTLPEVTLHIIQLVQDPQSTAHDLHQIVSNDPALSTRVLRVVNSAFYGLPGQVGSLDRAIILLGLNAIKNIAIAASLSKMFKISTICDDFTGQDLWKHSVAVGAANKLITQQIGLALPEDAFLAGLIHDIGLVAVMQCYGEQLPEIVNHAKEGLPFLQAEESFIGANHQDIGIELATRWKFPRSFHYVIGYHHNPQELARENRLMAIVTYLSDKLCARQHIGLQIVVQDEPIAEDFLSELSLKQEQLDQVAEQIEDEMEDIMAILM